MLKNEYKISESLYKENESLEIVEFIKNMLDSIDISNQSKILKSLNALKSNNIK
jgi:hypothetical protein